MRTTIRPTRARLLVAALVPLVCLLLLTVARTDIWRVILVILAASSIGAALADLFFDSGRAIPWPIRGDIKHLAADRQVEVWHLGTLGNMFAGAFGSFVIMLGVRQIPNAAIVGSTPADKAASLTVWGLVGAFILGFVLTLTVIKVVNGYAKQRIGLSATHLASETDRDSLRENLTEHRPAHVGSQPGAPSLRGSGGGRSGPLRVPHTTGGASSSGSTPPSSPPPQQAAAGQRPEH